MVLTDITSREKKRFEKLQKDGMLPSAALRKIETERRLGIIVDDEPSLLTNDTLYYVGGGAIAIAIIVLLARKPSTTP